MPWNQPGAGGPDEQDPWGQFDGRRGPRRGARGGGRGQRGDGPPDLDEIFREARNRFESLFGGGRGRGQRGRGNGGGGDAGDGNGGRQFYLPGGGLLGLVVLVVVGVWLFSGVYTVDQGEQAVELRFGKYLETNDAGLHWHIPAPFESVEIVNTQQVNTVEVGYRKGSGALSTVPREALMLTQDENIIDVQFAVQYDIKDPTDLLFNVSEFNNRNMAETVVRQATESAVREIVGRSTMDFAITEGRAQLASETKSLVQRILDRYETGINVRTVEMQNAQPPAQVKNAFDDVVKAREDEERIKNLAQAYANDIIPRARGLAARIAEEAAAYQASTVAKAEGEASRFEQVFAEYVKARDVTRDRLYIEAMEEVLANSSKMLIDQEDSDSILYLPLEQLLRGSGGGDADPIPGAAGAAAAVSQSAERAGLSGGGINRATGRNINRNARN